MNDANPMKTTKTQRHVKLFGILASSVLCSTLLALCPACEYLSRMVSCDGTDPLVEPYCFVDTFVPDLKWCNSANNTSEFECLLEDFKTRIFYTVAQSDDPSEDCTDCDSLTYTVLYEGYQEYYQCFTDDTDCGGNG